jgi:bacterioferritin-associated ferredoxin
MASILSAAEDVLAPEERPRFGPPMTRCECAGMSFTEIRRQLRDHGHSLEDLAKRTGCAGTCTACLPDLREFLARG